MKNYKIGVFGSKINEGEDIEKKAKELGQYLAKVRYVVITGAGSGVPYQVAHEAAKCGAEVWGYSIATDITSHKQWLPDYDDTIYSKLIFVPREYELSNDFTSRAKYRNILSTYNCDAAIIITGGWGTLDEFAHLMAYKKLVGVLSGTGGITSIALELVKALRGKDDNKIKVFTSNSSKELVDEISKRLDKPA